MPPRGEGAAGASRACAATPGPRSCPGLGDAPRVQRGQKTWAVRDAPCQALRRERNCSRQLPSDAGFFIVSFPHWGHEVKPPIVSRSESPVPATGLPAREAESRSAGRVSTPYVGKHGLNSSFVPLPGVVGCTSAPRSSSRCRRSDATGQPRRPNSALNAVPVAGLLSVSPILYHLAIDGGPGLPGRTRRSSTFGRAHHLAAQLAPVDAGGGPADRTRGSCRVLKARFGERRVSASHPGWRHRPHESGPLAT